MSEAAARTGSAGRSSRSPATPRGAAFSPAPARALTALTAGGLVAKAVKPGEADAFHFCGHTYTTGSCLHPTGLPRIDAHGYPLRADDGEPVDDLGRQVNRKGQPVDDRRQGAARPRRPAAAAGAADQGLRRDRAHYGFDAARRRRLVPLLRRHGAASSSTAAPTPSKRINGDAALEGYCYRGRKVFCVMYFQTKVPC